MSATLKTAPTPSGLSAAASAFLAARGLDPDLCEKLGLSSGPDRHGREWIAIPYERGDVRVNRKFRAIDKKEFRQDKGGEQIFWRHDCIADAGLVEQPLIITEGEFDAMAAIQAGYWRTISIPGGGNAVPQAEARTSGKYACVEFAKPAIDAVRHIIIAMDVDAVGAATLTDLITLLGSARCQFVSYPDGCKDLNDVLRLHGADGVRACIDNAKWVRVAGVHKLFDLPPLPPLETWRPNVLQPIDDLLPICPGQLSVWTGIPGYGKSSLVNAIVWSISERDDARIAHGTFEATPQREYTDDCIGFMTGIPAHQIGDDERERIRRWIQERITFIISDGYSKPGEEEFFDADLDWFFEGARTAVVRDGCRIVILDPWSQIEHSRSNAEPETTYIQRSIRRAKSFARMFDVHVAIVAHPTKQRKLDDGSYAMPEGYEISGSAHWFNGVDLGVTIHRAPPTFIDKDKNNIGPDPRSTRVLIRAWKKKNHRVMGKPGDAYASFDSNTGRYTPAEHWEEFTYEKRYPDTPVITERGDD